jgi:hypothetical protein
MSTQIALVGSRQRRITLRVLGGGLFAFGEAVLFVIMDAAY